MVMKVSNRLIQTSGLIRPSRIGTSICSGIATKNISASAVQRSKGATASQLGP